MKFLDCTLRDGGYYTGWDFAEPLINDYLAAVDAAGVDVVEIGFRFLKPAGFNGACAYTTDAFLDDLEIPEGLCVGVMVNAADLLRDIPLDEALAHLFPRRAAESRVSLVRVACHVHEFEKALPAADWLARHGYQVGFNLMQVADRSADEITGLAVAATRHPVDVLYFADSLGSLRPSETREIVRALQRGWAGELGVHTHDNLGLALSNTLQALDDGVTWADATVTGMGRGPGNARTEELAIEVARRRGVSPHLVPLMALLHAEFKPLQQKHGWGTNPYYYLAGTYGIHPTYIQAMLSDARYSEVDLLAVIEHLRSEGGKSFDTERLNASRIFYGDTPVGHWSPVEQFSGRDVLLLGLGPGVSRHRRALERYILDRRPLVLALNTQTAIDASLIDLRVACHPVRLLADARLHAALPQPLIAPWSMLPEDLQARLAPSAIRDFGLRVRPETFVFERQGCVVPTALVVAYALAVATSGGARRVQLAGFDGYGADDPRTQEMQTLLEHYQQADGALPLSAITPSRYAVHADSVYAR